MCIIVWTEGLHEEFPFILVSNRDEYFDRETAQAHIWEDHPTVIGGRDLRKQGFASYLHF
jgi:uncharacterized protein with NRDE domain